MVATLVLLGCGLSWIGVIVGVLALGDNLGEEHRQ